MADGDWKAAKVTLVLLGKERKSADIVAILKWLLPSYASKLGKDGGWVWVLEEEEEDWKWRKEASVHMCTRHGRK